MKRHTIGVVVGWRENHGHGNKTSQDGKKRIDLELTVKKVPASSVPYGESISRDGRTVWAAYCRDVLICIGATAGETRRKYFALRDGSGRPTKEGAL